MSRWYFWLGIDAEQYPEIEDDGFITVVGLESNQG